jgi:membrane protein
MLSLLARTYKDWTDDHVPVQAAALAYYTIFSVAPLLLVIIALVGLVAGQDVTRDAILQEVGGVIGTDGKNLVAGMLTAASANPQQGVLGLVLGLGALLVGATGVFAQLQQTLNTIWDVKPKEGVVALVRVRVVSFGLVLVAGFLLLVSLAASAAVTAFVSSVGVSILPQVVNVAASTLVAGLLFALIYKFLPDAPIAWADALWGGLFTSVLFNVGKLLIGLYLGRSAVASAYGAAGSLVVTLLWVYYSAQIVLFGAEFTQVRASARMAGSVDAPAADQTKSVVPPRASEPQAQTRKPWVLLGFTIGLIALSRLGLRKSEKG